MAMKSINILHRFLDFVNPRTCVVCGCRLASTEWVLCNKCNLHLPRTYFSAHAYDNDMAKLFWGQIPIERAAALFHYEHHADSANIIYQLKYRDHPEIGQIMGRMLATEISYDAFFDGIDGIVPVPLTKDRLRRRGYNQSLEIAKGVSKVAGLPIYNDVVRRVLFVDSQTAKSRWSRHENVALAFQLVDGAPIAGKHLLVVDDVVTTGATVIACAKELVKAGHVKISVLSLGCTHR